MSREEQILQAILNSGEYNKVPLSRLERDLIGILQQDKSLLEAPQSRIEELLHLLYDKVEAGSGGSSAPTFAYFTVDGTGDATTVHAYNFTRGLFGACATGAANIFIDETATITALNNCFGNKCQIGGTLPSSDTQIATVREMYLPALPNLFASTASSFSHNGNLTKIVTAEGENILNLTNGRKFSDVGNRFLYCSKKLKLCVRTDSTSTTDSFNNFSADWYPENGAIHGLLHQRALDVDESHPINTLYHGKLKVFSKELGSTSKGYGMFNGTHLKKIWLSKDVQKITITASGSTTSPWARFNGDIYCELDSPPSGWSANYMNKYSTAYNFTFHWGVTEQEFDALP